MFTSPVRRVWVHANQKGISIFCRKCVYLNCSIRDTEDNSFNGPLSSKNNVHCLLVMGNEHSKCGSRGGGDLANCWEAGRLSIEPAESAFQLAIIRGPAVLMGVVASAESVIKLFWGGHFRLLPGKLELWMGGRAGWSEWINMIFDQLRFSTPTVYLSSSDQMSMVLGSVDYH